MIAGDQETREAVLLVRFVEIPDLDLGSAGFLLGGLEDALALLWVAEWLREGPSPAGVFPLADAPSPVISRLTVTSALEVAVGVPGGLVVAQESVVLFQSVHRGRGTKSRQDLIASASRLLRQQLQREAPAPGTPATPADGAIRRASEAIALLDWFEVVDEDEAD